FTRTPLHVGAGSSVGAIDQPVIRERHTGFPVIPGSALKGVISDLWPRDGKARSADAARLFGAEDASAASAGALLFGEAKLLAFPVRSAKGAFAWLTSPLALARYARDTGTALPAVSVANETALVAKGTALAFAGTGASAPRKVIFEEYPFAVGTGTGSTAGEIPDAILAALAPAVTDAVWRDLAAHLAVVSDELFAYFAVNACEIAQHVRIDDATGTVAPGALFNQENVPGETLFYSPVRAKNADDLDALAAQLAAAGNLLQLGGDATTGLGFCSLNLTQTANA
ncbi:MAG: type III-B CRISPR module RAMP protein Cmr4, partial [Puniceicoccales bacterium]|nr:type III-B CRISPR module RAMP protein Cmr4 [Puniceicoccales bacterium]